MKNHLDLLLDKLFDGAFIFIGVFFAFFFNKCQADKMLRNELKLNLSQIMRELPDRAPDQTAKWFNLKQVKNADGTCKLETESYRLITKNGTRNLNVIMNRGLGNYLKESDRHVIPMISVYYDQIIDKSINNSVKFQNEIASKLLQLNLSKKCLSKKEIEGLKKPFYKVYVDYQQSRILSEIIGFEIYKVLQKIGIKKPEIKKLDVNFNFEIKD